MNHRGFFRAIATVVILTLPALFLMTKSGLYPSHDGLYHIARISEFHQSLQNGQNPPVLAPTIVNSFGYPLFAVNYQLPYWWADFFMLFNQDPFFAYKAVMSSSFILSSVFAYLLFKIYFSNLASVTGAIIFTYLPYRFASLYTRGALGESVALMFLPLLLFAISAKRITAKRIVLIAFSIFGLITAHTVIFLISLPFVFGFLLFVVKPSRERTQKIALGIILGILLSSFQLLPSIFEKKFLKFDQNLKGLYNGHFVSVFQLFRIPARDINIGTTLQLGLTAIFVALGSLLAFLKKKNADIAFFLTAILLSIFLILKASQWFWQNIPFLNYVLYPWRFLSIIVISISFMACRLVDNFPRKVIVCVFLIFLTMFSSRHYFLKPSQTEYTYPRANLTTQDEFDPVWVNGNTFRPRETITYDSPSTVLVLEHKPFELTFKIQAQNTTNVTISKLYFPGWNVKVNGEKHDVFQNNGLVSFQIPKGTWSVRAYFSQTNIRKLANSISFLSFLVLASLILAKFKLFKRCFTHPI